MAKKEKSNLTLVMMVRYATDVLEQALDSYDLNSWLDNELIIIADRPSWQTLKILQDRKIPHYTVPFTHYFICCNFGAWKAHREYVAFINDDVFFGPGWDVALMDIMAPNIQGSVFRYECNNGFCCGYRGQGDMKSFDPELLYKAIEKQKDHIADHHSGFPNCHHKETFFKYHGYTFHCGQGSGHELHWLWRLKEDDPNAKMARSYKSGIFHYGSAGNRDHIDNYPELGFRRGMKLCLGCGKWEFPESPEWTNTPEVSEIHKRGYWLCADCKKAGRGDVGKFRLWDFWSQEPDGIGIFSPNRLSG